MLVLVQLDGETRRIPRSELEALARSGRLGPETPVEWAGRWVPARELPEWGSWNRSTLARNAWDHPRVPWATALIVGLNVRVHLWLPHLPDPSAVYGRGARESAAIVEGGEVWRLLTYAFLHSGFEHILLNMVFVAYVGLAVERLLGAAEMLSLYTFSIVMAGLVSTFLSPGTPAVGASGGDFALLGAAAVLGYRWGDVIPDRSRRRFGTAMLAYAAWVIVNQIGAEGIDQWAHVGGLFAGLVYALPLRPGDGRRNTRVAVVGLGGLAAVVGAIVALHPRLEPMTPLEEDGTTTVRPAWWETGWVPTGEMGYSSPLHDAHLALHAETRSGPTTDAEMLQVWTDEVLALDPAAQVVVTGDRATARYQGKDGPREARARAVVKGVYTRTLIVDVPAGDRRGPWLDRALDELQVGPPKEIADALEGADSHAWRLKAKAARAAADFGDLDRAKALFAEIRAEYPDDSEPAVEELQLLRKWKDPALAAKADAALAAWPDRWLVVGEVAAAWDDLGEHDRAVALIQMRLLIAPGDRTLNRALRQLQR